MGMGGPNDDVRAFDGLTDFESKAKLFSGES